MMQRLAVSGSRCHTFVMADVLSSPKPSLACEAISYLDGRVLLGHALVLADVLSSPK